MKRKLLFLMAVALPLMVSATEPEAINIVHHDLTITSTRLDELTCLTFSSDETTVKIHTATAENEFIINDIRKVLFGEYIAPNDPTEVIEVRDSILDTHSVRKVLENGHLVIIRDGKRYNVLGTRI